MCDELHCDGGPKAGGDVESGTPLDYSMKLEPYELKTCPDCQKAFIEGLKSHLEAEKKIQLLWVTALLALCALVLKDEIAENLIPVGPQTILGVFSLLVSTLLIFLTHHRVHRTWLVVNRTLLILDVETAHNVVSNLWIQKSSWKSPSFLMSSATVFGAIGLILLVFNGAN